MNIFISKYIWIFICLDKLYLSRTGLESSGICGNMLNQAIIGQNELKKELAEMAGMAGNAWNYWKQLETAESGQKWLEMTNSGWKNLEMAKNINDNDES